MPMQDVSNDQSMISWLRQSGHGHLIDEHNQMTDMPSSAPQLSSTNAPYDTTGSSSTYPQTVVSNASPDLPMFMRGYHPNQPSNNMVNRSVSFDRDASPNPPMIPTHFAGSPTQMHSPTLNDPNLDISIENMRRDPNTRIVQRAPADDVVYKQRVFVRYLQPPTPPVGGTIIVREKQEPGPPPDPPIVIKRAPPPPPTPPPVIIRERPPPMPTNEGTTVIDKIIPSGPKPPPQVIVEQYPQLPPKPQDVIIERWLPIPPRQRRILYERLPPNQQSTSTRPIIVQYGTPQVRIQREVIAAPGIPLPFQRVTSNADINSLLNPQQLNIYNPNTSLPPSWLSASHQNLGLGNYGTSPMATPSVFNVPDNIPIDHVLRQLGVDPHSLQRSPGIPPINTNSAVSHVWDAASRASPPIGSDPRTAMSHVWNAASRATPPIGSDPRTAMSHVWNAASHAYDQNGPVSPSVGHVWNHIENYLHPSARADPGQPGWNSNAQNSAPPSAYNQSLAYNQSNSYSSPPTNSYPPPPPNGYPPPSNYPPSSSYPPSSNYPPASSYPPPSNYPPPSSYPPPSNYPPPNSYPPPYNNNPPASGGPSASGSGVLSRLFGGG